MASNVNVYFGVDLSLLPFVLVRDPCLGTCHLPHALKEMHLVLKVKDVSIYAGLYFYGSHSIDQNVM